MENKILVIGSMNMDLIIYNLSHIPVFGETIVGSSYAYAPGGKGGNQSVAVAKLGGRSSMVGAVGQDEHGNTLVSNLEKYGVDTNHIRKIKDNQTGLATIMVDDKTAQYVSYMVMGTNDDITIEQVEKALCDDVTMVLMQLEMPLDVVYQTYELAKAKGIRVFLDAGPAMEISLSHLEGIFVVSPNEVEIEALTGIKVVDKKTALLASESIYEDCKPEYVLLKLGSEGVFSYDGDKGTMHPSFKVDAVDSTAAGDTFGAGFAVSISEGNTLADAIQFGQAAAALCVSKKGAQSAIPSRLEVDEFIRKWR